MSTLLFIIVLLWLTFGNLVEVAIMQNKYNENCPVYSARFLYENTKMNWFGCWFCFISIRLLIPINTLIGLGVSILDYVCRFIKWLFTVGREDEDVD